MANQLQTANQQTTLTLFNEESVRTLRDTIAKDCSPQQFALFLEIAKSAGANPFHGEIYPAVRSGQLTVQFGVDYYVRKAKENPDIIGYDVQLVHANDEFQMHQERDEDGRYFIVIDKHIIGFPRGQVIGGYAIAYKEGATPFTVIMEAEEVEHFKRSQIGMQKTMWTNYFNDMFKKHMVRRALKAVCNLSEDEIVLEPGNSSVQEYTTTRKDITPQQEILNASQQERKDEIVTTEEYEIAALKKQLTKLLKEIGVTGKAATNEYIKSNAPQVINNPTVDNIEQLIAIVQMQIDLNSTESDDLE